MSNKLTDEELQAIKNIRDEYTNLAIALGELELQKFSLWDAQKATSEKESQLAQQLREKYGEGTIDLNTGEVK
jgi:hypothetical protein